MLSSLYRIGVKLNVLPKYNRSSWHVNEIQVAFEACSLNYRDLLVIEGKYNPRFERPLVTCSEGYSTVAKTYEGAVAV